MALEDKHLELLFRIDERSKAMDEKIDGINARLDTQNGRVEKVERRTSGLENWRWYIVGIVTALVVVGELLLKYL